MQVSGIHQLPMIEIRLPFDMSGSTTNQNHWYKDGDSSGELKTLKDYVDTTPQIYNAGGVTIPKRQSIFYCRDVIMFYVNRRQNTLRFRNRNFLFNNIPLTVEGNQKINPVPIGIDTGNNDSIYNTNVEFGISDDNISNKYALRSVVCVNYDDTPPVNAPPVTNEARYDHIKAKSVKGCHTIIVQNNVFRQAGNKLISYQPSNPKSQKPITETRTEFTNYIGGDDDESVLNVLRHQGTIYIYSVVDPQVAANI